MAKTTAPAEKNDAVPPSPTRRAGARGTVYNNVLETIGGTPLVRTSKFTAKYNLNVDVLAKLEFFNPMSSIKDRSALAIIEAAENAGKIIPGKSVIIESSSGNMAISLAFVAAAKGYRIILVMPESVPLERRKLLLLYGAEVVLTAAERGMKGAIETAQTLMKNTQFSWAPDQFNNPAAIEMHASTTAEELWADTNGRIDILVAGVGTGATISGIAQALKQKNPAFKSYAVEPAESPVLSGGDPGQHKIQGIGVGFKPPLLGKAAVDGIIQVPGADALEMARQIVRLEGIPCGISTGAAFAAVLDVAQIPASAGKTIVVMASSSSERYLSTELFKKLEN